MYKIFIVFTIIVITVSCSVDKKQMETRSVFRYNESKGISSLDPAFSRTQTNIWPVNQLFNGLVQMENDLQITPCIAKSWKISDNGTKYTFALRNDIYFHESKLFENGVRKVIASDFVYSLNRIQDPLIASPGAWIFGNIDGEKTADKTGFYAVNDTVLEVYLKEPFPAFLGLLTMQYCSVVPKEVAGYYGRDFRSHPIGTGPFYMKLWKEGEKLVFRKNENYFEKDELGNKLPYLDAIAISFINDKQSEFLEFVQGNLDYLTGLNSSYKDELITRGGKLNVKYSDRIVMLTEPYLNTEYLGFLLDDSVRSVLDSPIKIAAVRKAVNYGFDRKKMMTYLRNNIGTPATSGFVPKGLPSFSEENVKGFDYDPDKARELLSEAGFENGVGLPIIKLTTTSDYRDLCEYIQHELSQIGIKIEIDVNTGATFRDMVANSKLEFFRGSWIADYPDAENYLALFYSKNFSPSGPNYTHYKNEKFDSLYEASMKEVVDTVRYKYYNEMDQIIIDDAVVVPLFYDQVVRFTNKNIEGLGSNPMNLLTLKRVKKINNHDNSSR
jgi:peptide/nickel transport system substrate-binding protein